MGTVKYTGPVASFHCPTNAEIRSLKVHFSPKQEGSGDPSPENVRPIVGWDGVEVEQSGKNLMHLLGYSAVNHATPAATRILKNSYGTTISTINSENSIVITQENWPAVAKSSYQNGYFVVMDDNLKFEEHYDISFRVTNIINNPLNATLSDLVIYNPRGTSVGSTKIIDGDRITFKNAIYNQSTTTPLRRGFDIRICGMSCTISDFIVTAVDTKDRVYEPYHGSTTNYEFGVLGKNKFPLRATNQFLNTSTGNSNTIARDMTTGDVYVNISSNNYWQGKSSRKYGISISDGTLSFHSDDNSYGVGVFVPVFPDTTYTLSHTGFENGRTRVGYYNADGQHLNVNISKDSNVFTFTTNADTEYILVVFCSKDNVASDYTVSNIQLELGSTATAYEPYNPNKTVYGGWVDLVSGEVCEEYNCIDLGTLDYTLRSNIGTGCFSANIGTQTDNLPYAKDLWSGYCSAYEYLGSYNDVKKVNRGIGYIYTRHVVVKDLSVTEDDTSATKSALDGVILAYQLATPLTYQLAPTSMQTFLSQNNVWSNADYVEVEYDLHETQTILARKQFIIANQPHVVKSAAAPLQNFVTDVAAPLKSCKVEFKPIQDLHGYDRPWVGGSGKNLFNENDITYNKWTEGGGNVVNNAPYGVMMNNQIFIPAGTTVYLTIFGDTVYSKGIVFYNTDGTFNSRAYSIGTGQITYTVAIDCYMAAEIANNPGETITEEYVKAAKVVLSVGSAATAYEPWENICPISGWTGTRVYHSGKNILPITDTRVQNQQQIDFPGGVLSFSAKTPNEEGSPQFIIHNNDGSQVKYWTMAGKENGVNYRDNINAPSIPKYRINVSAYDAQVELGETHTEYEPFKGSVNTIDWTDEAGTVYGGYVDLVNGELVQEWEIASARWGDIKFGNPDNTTGYYTGYLPTMNSPKKITTSSAYGVDIICNSIGKVLWEGGNKTPEHIYAPGPEHNRINILGNFNDDLVIQIAFKLAEPIHYPLTIEMLKTLRGTNNIWASNGGDNIELSYWKH